jgi:hypothetical protein
MALPDPGSGSIENTKFSSVGGGGGGGVGVVSFLEQEKRKKTIIKKIEPLVFFCIIAISYKIKKIIDFEQNKFFLMPISNCVR